jgi:hypothetical protein
MKLVNMALKNEERLPGGVSVGSQNKYGYGLCIHLDDAQCEMLGLDKSLPAGTTVKIEATGIVESSGERVDREGGKGNDVNMSVQITDLGLEATGTAVSPAKALYTNATS